MNKQKLMAFTLSKLVINFQLFFPFPVQSKLPTEQNQLTE
jgi:hypothetical protein